ncbi:MAG: hypothetical protein NT096_06780 [Proteobacteria bacterium]|nr:hypothetical protein [Pseudomonadota bacterium]
MRKEYDFSKGKRGKFYRSEIQINLPVYLEPDLRKFFPDSESVNKALRCLLPLLSRKKSGEHIRHT